VDDCIALFSSIQRPDCRINVHLLAHSTGAYVVREAFDDADDRPAVAQRNWMVSQIALIGGDVSSQSMSEGNATTESLMRHCVRLTNYSNPYDSVLKLSNVKRLGAAPRVGRVGLPEAAGEVRGRRVRRVFPDPQGGRAKFVGTSVIRGTSGIRSSLRTSSPRCGRSRPERDPHTVERSRQARPHEAFLRAGAEPRPGASRLGESDRDRVGPAFPEDLRCDRFRVTGSSSIPPPATCAHESGFCRSGHACAKLTAQLSGSIEEHSGADRMAVTSTRHV